MMEPINIGDLVPEELLAMLSPDMVRTVARDIMTDAKNHWSVLAGRKLTSSFPNYIRGLQEVQTKIQGETAVYSISLTGAFPNMIENGWSAYDMRDTLLGPDVPIVSVGGGRGKHVSAKGDEYRSIPFRIGAPGATGGNFPAVTDLYAKKLGQRRAKKLGRKIWQVAKRLGATTSDPGQATNWGERMPAGMAPKAEAHHATDLFAGLYRFEQSYERATQATYGTFRTISTNVTERAGGRTWFNSGYAGAHIHKEVAEYIGRIAAAKIETMLGEM